MLDADDGARLLIVVVLHTYHLRHIRIGPQALQIDGLHPIVAQHIGQFGLGDEQALDGLCGEAALVIATLVYSLLGLIEGVEHLHEVAADGGDALVHGMLLLGEEFFEAQVLCLIFGDIFFYDFDLAIHNAIRI